MSGVERHGSCHPVPATARTVPWPRDTRPLLPLREDLGPPCHSRNHVSLISRGARGSEAGARGSGLAAERRSVVVMVGTTTPDYDTGAALWHRITTQVGVFPSFRGTHRHGDALRADGGLVTLTIGLFTLGAHLDRKHVRRVGVVLWIASFVCLLAMNVTVRQSEQPTLVLLFCFGFLVGWPWQMMVFTTLALLQLGHAPAVPSERESFSWAPGPTHFYWSPSSGRSRSGWPSSTCRPCSGCSPPRPSRRSSWHSSWWPRPPPLSRVELEKWILRRQSRRSRRIPA
jgi:hypothetical protein